VQLRPDRLHGGQRRVGVAFLGDQPTAHFHGGQPGIQPPGAELRISLALAVNERRDVGEQGGQAVLRPLAAPQGEGVDDGDAARQLAGTLADRPPVPPEFALGPPLPTRPQLPRRPRHEHAAGAAAEGPRGLNEQRLMPVGQFHQPSPCVSPVPAPQYTPWGDYFYARP